MSSRRFKYGVRCAVAIAVAALAGGAAACAREAPAAPATSGDSSNTSGLLQKGTYSLVFDQNPQFVNVDLGLPACSHGLGLLRPLVTDTLVFSFNTLGQWQGSMSGATGGDGGVTFSALSGAALPDGSHQITIKFSGLFVDMVSTNPCDSIVHDARIDIPNSEVVLGSVAADGRSASGVRRVLTTITFASTTLTVSYSSAESIRWTLKFVSP